MIYSHSLLVTFFIQSACSFLSPAISVRSANKNAKLFSSSGNDELDSMRRLLEASWDVETMGQVPSDATAGANEAFSSISSASDRGVGVFFVDLLLPSYDVTQGSNLYDEVLSAEYCIALSECLKGKTEILVRDKKMLKTINRMLEIRERDVEKMDVQDELNDDEEEDDDDDDGDEEEDEINEDEEDVASSSENESLSDVDAFRKELMSNWGGEDNQKEDNSRPESSQKPDLPEKVTKPTKPKKEKAAINTQKRYRLASLFGRAIISQGIDMMDQVVQALRVNALPTDEEENIIILSAVTREEMIAVRSLVAKYEGEKKIILVNCKLDPIPPELRRAVTVYSLLPLIARVVGTESGQSSEGEPPRPKIVVLRRYPKEWEVYVDVGGGFQLAASAPPGKLNQRSPPMEWVAERVQKYLETKGR